MNKTFLKITKQVTGGGLRAVLPLCLCALFSVLLTSCPNSADDSYSPPAQTQQASPSSPSAPATTVPAGGTAAAPEAQYITFKGSVQTTGALPASYARAVDDLFLQEAAAVEGAQIDVARSARPDATVDGELLKFFATATAREDGTVVEGNFDVEGADDPSVFEMDLAVGKTWDIVCGVRKTEGGQIVFQDTYSKQVTAEDSALKHQFELLPVQAGSGSISLTVNFSAPAVKVEARWEKDYANVPALSPAVATSSPATFNASSVPCGSYNIILSFKDGNGIAVYESVQSATVLNGLETNTWTLEGGEGAITEDSDHVVSFNVGDTLVKDTTSNWIYVGVPKDLVGQEGVSASDENKGGAYSPLETLGAAFKKIQSAGKGDKDFQIYVSGAVVGSSTLGSEIAAGVNAKSITIQGLAGNASDSLKGSGSGSVLEISSNVPVIVKNIKITGGDSVEKGGGLFIKADGASVTLENGTLISENKAEMQGGAVYISGSPTYTKNPELVIKDGAKISGNSLTGNAGSMGGMAIWADSSSKVTMKGGEISGHNSDSEYHDGTVLLTGSAVFDLEGGKVTENTAKESGANFFIYDATLNIKGGEISKGTAGGANVSEAQGAGVYVSDSGSVNMSGGKITGNKLIANSSGEAKGAGICANAPAQVNLTGGAIEGNYVDKSAAGCDCKEKGGAVYVEAKYSSDYMFATLSIGGSPSIPCPSNSDGSKTPGNNDVYLARAVKDSEDGGKYSMVQVSSLTPPAGVSKVAVITAQDWQRGLDILKAPTGSEAKDYNKYFDTTAQDFGFKQRSGDANKNIAMLKADLYVSPRGTDEGSNDGTKAKPYRSIQRAIEKLSSPGEPETIYVDCKNADGSFAAVYVGKSEGIRTVNCINDLALRSSNCSELTICGVNGFDTNGAPKDFLDNQTGMTGVFQSTVYVSSPIPVTFKKLLIKGGSVGTEIGSDRCGAGLCVKKENGSSTAPVVKLAEGAMVSGNRLSDSGSTKGGGVYVGPGASLYMYGSAWIGDKKQALVTGKAPASVAGASNSAKLGGGLYNDGNVYIGYTGKNGSTLVPATGADVFTGGVSNNYSGAEGGGIYNAGTLEIAGGEICYNGSVNGAGVYIAAEKTFAMTGGELKGNSASTNGGAVYIDGTFSMNGGTLNGNKAGDGSGAGCGVYDAGTFNISGSAYIPKGAGTAASPLNDVYLVQGKYVNITDALSPKDSSGTAKDASIEVITPQKWLRGTQVLGGTGDGAASVNVNKNKFKLDDAEWKVIKHPSSDPLYANQGVMDTDYIYVASATPVENSGISAPPAEADRRGTKAAPYATIDEASKQCWTLSKDFTIKISGKIGSASAREFIGSDTTANKITLEGANGDNTKDIIDRGLTTATDSGSALEVSSGAHINVAGILIKNLKITGGATTNNGGGILLGKQCNLTLGQGALICGNTAKYGGGISYIQNTSNVKLVMLSGSEISGNSAEEKGGGIYICLAKLYMSGTALIGQKVSGTANATKAAYKNSDTDKAYSNFAKSGGGVYCDEGAEIRLGYATDNTITDDSKLADDAGILFNYSVENGGGICAATSNSYNTFIYMASGNVSNNGCSSNKSGGGIYLGSGSQFSQLTMTGGKIDCNHAGNGGGVYLNTTGALLMSGGSMSGNTAGTAGGAVYANETSSSGSSFGFQIQGSANLYTDSNAEKTNDVYLASGKVIGITGNLSKDHVATLTPSEWKRGTTSVISQSTYTEANKSKFNISDPDWKIELKESTGASKTGVIDADIWVASSAETDTTRASDVGIGGDSNRGTKSQPYATLSKAVAACWDKTKDFTIKIDGKVTGAQVIGNSSGNATNINAKTLTLEGYIPQGKSSSTATLDGEEANNTHTLFVNAKTKLYSALSSNDHITIKNLTITGGNASDDGGGIYLKEGAVHLADGAVVAGNKAKNGGGVYIGGNGYLFMYGKSIVGAALDAAPTSKAAAINKGTNYTTEKSGGGIYNAGKVYIGYSELTDGEPAGTEMYAGNYGVIGNYAESDGGGIYNDGGTVMIKNGNVSYNFSKSSGGGLCVEHNSQNGTATISGGTFQGNVAIGNGGAIAINTKASVSGTQKVTINGSAYFYSNQATSYGGAIYNNKGTLTMTAGTIGTSGKLNKTTGSYPGGAIHSNGTFNISGNATIYAGSKKNNDVYLVYYNSASRVVNIAATGWTGSMTITPESYSTTDAYLTESSSGLMAANYQKFTVTPTTGSTPIQYYMTSSGKLLTIKSPKHYASTPTSNVTVAACSQADLKYMQDEWISKSSTGMSNLTIKVSDAMTLDNTWAGIGSSSKPFKGKIDGNNKQITFGADALHPAAKGLIVKAENATIENLKLAGNITASASSSDKCGAVADFAVGTTKINNCTSSCNVTVTGTSRVYAGGIVGIVGESDNKSRDCLIEDCVNTGSVTTSGSSYTGGIVGEAYCCKILNCEMRGNITGTWYVGGILACGFNKPTGESYSSYIENCCVTGTITGTGTADDFCGGIFGSSTVDASLALNCCFAGTIVVDSSLSGYHYKGGLCGLRNLVYLNCPYKGGSDLYCEGSANEMTPPIPESEWTLRVDSITSETISRLNNAWNYIDGDKLALSSYASYRQWQLVSGKPQLVR